MYTLSSIWFLPLTWSSSPQPSVVLYLSVLSVLSDTYPTTASSPSGTLGLSCIKITSLLSASLLSLLAHPTVIFTIIINMSSRMTYFRSTRTIFSWSISLRLGPPITVQRSAARSSDWLLLVLAFSLSSFTAMPPVLPRVTLSLSLWSFSFSFSFSSSFTTVSVSVPGSVFTVTPEEKMCKFLK